MKKRIVITWQVAIILAVGLFCSNVFSGDQETRDGFIGFRWGTSMAKIDSSFYLVEFDGGWGEDQVFLLGLDSLYGVKIGLCHLKFFNDSLSSVDVEIIGDKKNKQFLEKLMSIYGDTPVKINESIYYRDTTYLYNFEQKQNAKTHRFYQYTEITQRGSYFVSSIYYHSRHFTKMLADQADSITNQFTGNHPNLEDGFLGFAWGTSEKDIESKLSFRKLISDSLGSRTQLLDTDSLFNVEIDTCTFTFYDDKFYRAVLIVTEIDNVVNLYQALVNKFGEPDTMKVLGTSYLWPSTNNGNKTWRSFELNDSSVTGIFEAYSLPIRNEMWNVNIEKQYKK